MVETVGRCLLCPAERNWGTKFKVGSALCPTTQSGLRTPLQTASHFPCKSESVYIYMHIKSLFVSGWVVSSGAITPLMILLESNLMNRPRHWNHICNTSWPLRCSPPCFLLFVTQSWFTFHFRCVLSSWSNWDSYPYHMASAGKWCSFCIQLDVCVCGVDNSAEPAAKRRRQTLTTGVIAIFCGRNEDQWRVLVQDGSV